MVFIDEVCQAVVNAASQPWGIESPPATAVWGYVLNYDEDKDLGRRVNIFPDPAGLVQSGTGTRRNDQFDYAVLLVVCEKCPVDQRVPSTGAVDVAGVSGQPTRDWMTERIRWSIQFFRRLSNARADSEDPAIKRLEVKSFETGEISTLIPQLGEVVSIWDPEAAARGIFQAQFRIVYRELE